MVHGLQCPNKLPVPERAFDPATAYVESERTTRRARQPIVHRAWSADQLYLSRDTTWAML